MAVLILTKWIPLHFWAPLALSSARPSEGSGEPFRFFHSSIPIPKLDRRKSEIWPTPWAIVWHRSHPFESGNGNQRAEHSQEAHSQDGRRISNILNPLSKEVIIPIRGQAVGNSILLLLNGTYIRVKGIRLTVQRKEASYRRNWMNHHLRAHRLRHTIT